MINIHEAKTHLSKYLAKLKRGEKLILCNRNTPVAEISLLPKVRHSSRPIGLAKKQFQLGAKFFEPLPADYVASFEGV